MNKIIILILALLTTDVASAQYAYFATRGTINFDKITFTRARMRDMQQKVTQNTSTRYNGGGRGFGDLENYDESTSEKYILDFDENTTLMYVDPNTQSSETIAKGKNNGGTNFRLKSSSSGKVSVRSGRPDNSAKVLFQDLKNNTSEVQIQIDDKYIITDSLNEITWRFSEEYRNIAGYECRRVNGATKDSLYLIAFYTDELPLAAGPALTSGLPGMILGLVIPEMHIQYWATKVEYSNEIVKNDWKDKKAKSLALDEFVNSFGRFFQRGRDSNSNKRQILEQLIY